jgi:uncharacterized membrane protein YbaN (DUF454 family)
MRIVWLLLGSCALALGILGIPLPLIPTVPFLLLAAFCFARSSERLHAWLVKHPRLGPPISDWNTRGAISRKAKYAASLTILASLAITISLGSAPIIVGIQFVTLCAVALFIWSRPGA